MSSISTTLLSQTAPTNLDFEANELEDGWFMQGFNLEDSSSFLGEKCIYGERSGTMANDYSIVSQHFKPGEAMRKLLVSAFIKTKGLRDGEAVIWCRFDGEAVEKGERYEGQVMIVQQDTIKILAFDNMYKRGLRGTNDWTKLVIELQTNERIENISFGALYWW